MGGFLWSLLLELGPVRRGVEREVGRAVALEHELAQAALRSDRERQRKLLRRRDNDIVKLRADNARLSRQVVSLEADARTMRRELARAEYVRQEKEAADRRMREQRAAEAALDERSSTDLFCCQSCASLWLLTTRPDQTCQVRRPAGDGCGTCNDQPLQRFWEIKTSAAELAVEVARPVSEPAGQPVVAELPSARAERVELGVELTTELVREDPADAVAKTFAAKACELARKELDQAAPPGGCAGLHAIAEGLDKIPKVVRDGIAWCATEIIGMPEFPAKVISRLVTLAVLEPVPLDVVAKGIRVFGTVSCVADNCVGKCACVRDLVSKEVAEPVIAEKLAEVIKELVKPPVPEIDEPAAPPVRRWLRGPGSL